MERPNTYLPDLGLPPTHPPITSAPQELDRELVEETGKIDKSENGSLLVTSNDKCFDCEV